MPRGRVKLFLRAENTNPQCIRCLSLTKCNACYNNDGVFYLYFRTHLEALEEIYFLHSAVAIKAIGVRFIANVLCEILNVICISLQSINILVDYDPAVYKKSITSRLALYDPLNIQVVQRLLQPR